MKFFILIILIGAAIFMLGKLNIFLPAPAKAYYEYRQKIMSDKGFSPDMTASTKWSLNITNCEVKGKIATISATEKTSKIPPNAASHTFATKITRKIKATVRLSDKSWRVEGERILSEEVSTYEDRKKL